MLLETELDLLHKFESKFNYTLTILFQIVTQIELVPQSAKYSVSPENASKFYPLFDYSAIQIQQDNLIIWLTGLDGMPDLSLSSVGTT